MLIQFWIIHLNREITFVSKLILNKIYHRNPLTIFIMQFNKVEKMYNFHHFLELLYS